MIEPLTWESAFFGRRMGALTGSWLPGDVARDVASARADDYQYLTSRPPVEDAAAIRTLEAAGFYFTDLGVTWATDVAAYLQGADREASRAARPATAADVGWLSRTGSTLFPASRFYHDPFYTTADANRFYEAWLVNSVSGEAADAVFMIPESGFVTAKIARDGAGEIVLIGVVDDAQNQGAGRALMTAALEWFASQSVAAVRVKTQVKNLRAMNFYHRLGFDLHSTDITLGCILAGGAR